MNRLVIITIFLFALTGCVGGYHFVKAYQGSELPSEKLAFLKPSVGITIYSIDDDTSNVMQPMSAMEGNEYEIALLPGYHVVEVSFDNGAVRVRGTIKQKFYAEAGRRYLIKSKVKGGGFLDPFGRAQWRPEISDVTGKVRCWEHDIGTMFNRADDC